MCGICGIIDFNGAPVRRQSIEKMADSLWHRGPDDAGYHFEPAVEWFRSDLLERAHELMFESNEWLNVPYLRLLWNRHHNKIQDHSAILWGSVYVQAMARTFRHQPEASSDRNNAFTQA
jgi:hypothetical protein